MCLKTMTHFTMVIYHDYGLGAQPALHFGGGNFHQILFDDVIVFIQP